MSVRTRLVIASLLATLLLAACSGTRAGFADVPVARPSAPVLTSPVAAVRSYLDWTLWALATGASVDASPTMSADEFVRVDAYVEMQRQRDRRILEHLDRFTPGTPSTEGSRSVLTAREEWTYRYVAISSAGTSSPAYRASYEATYTLVRQGDAWVVDRVDSTALTPVP